MATLKVGVIFLVLCYAAGELQKESAAQHGITSLFHEFWEWKLVNNPEFATRIGVFKYDNRVNELSLSSFKRRASEIGMFLHRLRVLKKSIDVHKNPTLALNIDLLESDLQQYVSGTKFNTYVWPLNIMEGPQNDYTTLLNMMQKHTSYHMYAIITRMRLFAQQIREIIELLSEGLRIRQTMNRKSFEKLLPIYKKIATAKAEENPFYKPFQQQPKNISNTDWKHVVVAAKSTINNYIKPAYNALYVFMHSKYLPKSRKTAGIYSVPNGHAYYQALLKYHTTTNLSPKEVHAVGLKEVTRITARMEKVKKVVKFNGTLDEFRQFLRTSKRFGFKNGKVMVNHYKGIRAKVEKLLPSYFGVLPKLPFVIEPVPADLAPSSPMAYYNEPSPDGSRPGIFSINTYEPEKRRSYIAESLFLHEAVPGHHLQIALKLEHGSPMLLRRFAGSDTPYYQAPASFAMNTAYTEGWGLYAEYLGEEMGFYKDPYVLFGRLSQEMLRACRLVVDTGMHALKWTRSKAINFMAANTADDLHDIEAETDRYISIPGQACAYKIGEIKIRKLREMAQDRLGKKFDVRKFHDFLLSVGNIPLTVLEKQVKLFITKQLHL